MSLLMRILKILHTYTLTYTEGNCIPKYTPRRLVRDRKKHISYQQEKMNVMWDKIFMVNNTNIQEIAVDLKFYSYKWENNVF